MLEGAPSSQVLPDTNGPGGLLNDLCTATCSTSPATPPPIGALPEPLPHGLITSWRPPQLCPDVRGSDHIPPPNPSTWPEPPSRPGRLPRAVCSNKKAIVPTSNHAVVAEFMH